MTPLIGLATTIIGSVYLGQCFWLRQGLLRAARDSFHRSDEQTAPIHSTNPRFSVIIAARNEEKNIAACLHSVFSQTIDPALYEVIVVDDRSSDATASLVRDLKTSQTNLSLIKISETPRGLSPKKHAVSQGVASARGAIMVFTDADCLVPSTWLATIDRFFVSDTGMVQGITVYHDDPGIPRWLYGLQAVDFLSHGIVAASGIGAGLPINSNANNFAFRREAFDDALGYGSAASVISGDDDLLMQRIWRSKKWKVRFMADPAGAVTTAPSPTLAAVLGQRKRWASKTVHYHPQQAFFLSSIFLLYCSIPAAAFAGIFNPQFFIIAVWLIFLKVVGELQLMLPGTALFGKKDLKPWIVPASIVHLPLVLYAVFGGVFGTFAWKGQDFHRKAKANAFERGSTPLNPRKEDENMTTPDPLKGAPKVVMHGSSPESADDLNQLF